MEFESRILDTVDYYDNGELVDRILTLETPADFSFSAGQFVMIAHDAVKNKNNSSQLKWGSMSVSSSPHMRGKIELVISVGSPEGITYFASHKLQKGDSLKVRGPFGVFGIREEFDRVVFVATGTGIAPLLAMIRDLLDKGEKRPIELFFGFQKKCKFLYEKEIMALTQTHSNFSVHFICSRETGPTGRQGYVQELFSDAHFDPKSNTQFYLCGPPVAVTDIRKAIEKVGFAAKQIHFEQW